MSDDFVPLEELQCFKQVAEELRPGITRIKKEGDDVGMTDNKGNPYNPYKPVYSKAHQAFADASKSDGSTASYYELPEGAKELQELISHRNMNAQLGEIFRACYRYGIVSHSEELRDAKKIKFYAEAEIARLEKLKND